MRLIDADFTKTVIKGYIANNEVSEAFAEIAGLICDMLDACETVDVVEVVHGRWETAHIIGEQLFGYDPFEIDVFACSVCGAQFDVSQALNYCPNCGAKMDGGLKNE